MTASFFCHLAAFGLHAQLSLWMTLTIVRFPPKSRRAEVSGRAMHTHGFLRRWEGSVPLIERGWLDAQSPQVDVPLATVMDFVVDDVK